jgi:hypothetical protein
MVGRGQQRLTQPIERVTAGTVVGGYYVLSVADGHDGPWTVTEAVDPDGGRVTLYVAAAGATEDPAVRRCVDGLLALRRAGEVPLLLPRAVGESDGLLYVARTPPASGTLAGRLRDGPLEPEEALRLLSQVAGAIDTLSAFGLSPGPLRPDRIALSARPPAQALLWDFGLDPRATRACRRPDLLEQVAYLAPEAARGAPVEPASTVYALACILVECLTGVPPFGGKRPLLVLEAHFVQPPPRLSGRGALPRELDEVLRTALSKLPEQRQRSAASLMRASQRALGRRTPIPVVEPPPPAPAPHPTATPAQRPRRRVAWPAPAGAGIGVTLLLASTAGFATANLQRTATPERPPSVRHAAPQDPAAVQRAAYVGAVDDAITRLSDRRSAARHRLSAARRAGAQATAATGLVRVYLDTERALPRAPAGVPSAGALASELRSAARAYRGLGAAARRGDARAFSAARASVVTRELSVQRVLGRLSKELARSAG